VERPATPTVAAGTGRRVIESMTVPLAVTTGWDAVVDRCAGDKPDRVTTATTADRPAISTSAMTSSGCRYRRLVRRATGAGGGSDP
jgi:hypothetical protein